MKRALCLVLMLLTLSGCGKNSGLDEGMRLRTDLQQSNGCSFEADITADYGEKLYNFSMHCQADASGRLTFTVTEPVTIAGISGVVDETGGNLTFDEKALAFPTIADGVITPVGAPWLLVHAMTGGYLRACEKKDDGCHLVIDDSYRQSTFQVELYCDGNRKPVRGEILWESRRIIAIDIENFTLL